jgi:hypothetical protein
MFAFCGKTTPHFLDHFHVISFHIGSRTGNLAELDPMRMPYSGIRSGMTNPEYIVLDAVHRE